MAAGASPEPEVGAGCSSRPSAYRRKATAPASVVCRTTGARSSSTWSSRARQVGVLVGLEPQRGDPALEVGEQRLVVRLGVRRQRGAPGCPTPPVLVGRPTGDEAVEEVRRTERGDADAVEGGPGELVPDLRVGVVVGRAGAPCAARRRPLPPTRRGRGGPRARPGRGCPGPARAPRARPGRPRRSAPRSRSKTRFAAAAGPLTVNFSMPGVEVAPWTGATCPHGGQRSSCSRQTRSRGPQAR